MNLKYLIIIVLLFFFVNLILNSQKAFSLIQEDEFKEFVESNDDEFKEFNEDDEFKEFNSNDTASFKSECNANHEDCPNTSVCNTSDDSSNTQLAWIIWILGFTILAGIFVRFKNTRNLRGIFLITSVIILGFFDSPCTVCPINGIQNFLLIIFGYKIALFYLTFFIGLIVITYLFGKVYCGWICHLGAIQELIYLPGKIKIFQNKDFQNIAKISRYILLIALIIQIGLMGTKYWCRIDPFITLFDLKWFNDFLFNDPFFDIEMSIMITLLLLLIISSVFIYRPFCKTMCPVGLSLGFVSKIPGASVVGLDAKCAGCIKCSNACNFNAITRDEKTSTLENSECISCGDCIDVCNNNGLKFLRKSKINSTTLICKNEYSS